MSAMQIPNFAATPVGIVPPLRPIPSLPGYYVTYGGAPYGPTGPLGTYVYNQPGGYRVVLFCAGPRRSGSRGSRRYRVARAVCEAWHGPAMGRLACHTDGDSLNCAAWNVYWGTPLQNAADARRHALQRQTERRDRVFRT